MAGRGVARRGKARRGKARINILSSCFLHRLQEANSAGHGRARLGKAGHGKAGRGKARQGFILLSRPESN
jgi:hypothetical protein